MKHRLSKGAIMLIELFMYFCIKKYIGTQGEVCRRVSFCHFSLPLGVGGWLRFVIVALPGLFY